MGMTPLEGLIMGTRSGDIDPAIIFYLGRQASRHSNRRRTGNCRANCGMYKNIETRQQILILIKICFLRRNL
jgi:hypothetical protein